MPREIAERSGRLPVHLIDDLLEITADQRLEQVNEARVQPDTVQHRLMIGRPLDHPHQRLASVPLARDVVEEIAVAEAPSVRRAFGVDLVQRSSDFLDFAAAEKAANDSITVAPIMREIGIDPGRILAPQCLRRTHG